MPTRRYLYCALFVGCGLLLTSVDSVDARPNYKSLFVKKYGKYYKSRRKLLNCLVCHVSNDGNKPNTKQRNIYGQTFRILIGGKNEKDKEKLDKAFRKAEKKPSAIPGKTFGDLIRAGILPAAGS